jgi:hypothetical protein
MTWVISEMRMSSASMGKKHAPVQKSTLPPYIKEPKDVQQVLLWLLGFSLNKLEAEGMRYNEALKHGDSKNLRSIGQTITSLIPQTVRVLDLLRETLPEKETESLAELLAKIPDQVPMIKTEKEGKRVVKLLKESPFLKEKIV